MELWPPRPGVSPFVPLCVGLLLRIHHIRLYVGVNGHFTHYFPLNPSSQSHSRKVIPRTAHPQGTLHSRFRSPPRP